MSPTLTASSPCFGVTGSQLPSRSSNCRPASSAPSSRVIVLMSSCAPARTLGPSAGDRRIMEQAQHRIAVADRVLEIIATHDDIRVANLGNLTYTPATNAYGTTPISATPSSSRTTAARRIPGQRYLSRQLQYHVRRFDSVPVSRRQRFVFRAPQPESRGLRQRGADERHGRLMPPPSASRSPSTPSMVPPLTSANRWRRSSASSP